MRLWRWLCCLTGHHRETVFVGEFYKMVPTYYGFSFRYTDGVEARCMDCPHTRLLYEGLVVTPSRRYALRRQGRTV